MRKRWSVVRSVVACALALLFGIAMDRPSPAVTRPIQARSKARTIELWQMVFASVPSGWRVVEMYPYDLGFPVYQILSPDEATIRLEFDNIDPVSRPSGREVHVNGMIGARTEHGRRIAISLLLSNPNSRPIQRCAVGYTLCVSYSMDNALAPDIVRSLRPRKPLRCLTVMP